LARQGGVFKTQYKRLLDNASVGIMLFNIESGRIMEANRTLSELLGYSDKEITALPAATLWADPAEKDLLFDRLKSGFAVINFESKFLSKSGEIRSLLISCKEIEFEKVFEFTLLDINALKGLESAIGNTQEYYRQTSGYPCNLTFLQDIEGCCYEIQWNDAEKYGIDTKRLLGKSLHDVMPAKEAVRYKECLNEVRDTRKPVECETTFTVNNREYFFSMRLLPLLDAAGSVTGFMGMCRDITEERGEREAKVQLEREIKHRRDFITTAAHELRTPLQPILGYLHLLLDDPDLYSLDAETTRILRMCLVNVERERRIVDRMLELSILYNGRIQIDLEYIPICNLVNTLIENGGYGTEANIENRIPEDVIMRVDGNCMYQVIETLVSNAIRYNTSPKSVWITYREDKTNHYLSVQDNGIGIEERALESIFKPFYLPDAANLSRQTNRMGLGLSIAREYIGLHGGDISVESHMGEGSTFTVRIPKEVPE
ncbi:MAG TPA: ATP-binding protein, partial [Methanomicrobiales archaeon]|nr:ATP-binding protein [Methanomicrobiales archaeon]